MPLYKKKTTNSASNGIQIPTRIKTAAAATDYALMIDSEGIYKITTADLFAGLSSGGSGGSTPATSTILTFASSGDSNGVCYWLGAKTGTWGNPHTSGILEVSASSLQAGTVSKIVDRRGGILMFSYDTPGSWIAVDFKNYKVKPNYYSIRHDNEVGYYLRSWNLQGSNDNGGTWINLDSKMNNTMITGAEGWGSFAVNISTFYRMLRIISTGPDANGSNYFCIGEIEFYGEVAVV